MRYLSPLAALFSLLNLVSVTHGENVYSVICTDPTTGDPGFLNDMAYLQCPTTTDPKAARLQFATNMAIALYGRKDDLGISAAGGVRCSVPLTARWHYKFLLQQYWPTPTKPEVDTNLYCTFLDVNDVVSGGGPRPPKGKSSSGRDIKSVCIADPCYVYWPGKWPGN